MATVKEIIERAYTKVNGEFEAVEESSDDFKTYRSVLNQVLQIWADTPYVKWQSLYNPDYILPETVTQSTLTYTIPDEVVLANSPFDSVYLLDDSENLLRMYKVTDQALFDATSSVDVCAVFGNELHFKEIDADIVGASIRLPVYARPPEYTTASQAVSVDSVSWLVTYMAAFICDASPVPFISRNADKYYKQAEILMKTMRDNNRHRQHLVVKKAQQTIDDQRFGSLSQAINAGFGAGGGGNIQTLDGGEF